MLFKKNSAVAEQHISVNCAASTLETELRFRQDYMYSMFQVMGEYNFGQHCLP